MQKRLLRKQRIKIMNNWYDEGEGSESYKRKIIASSRQEAPLIEKYRKLQDKNKELKKANQELNVELDWWRELVHRHHENYVKSDLKSIVQSFIDDNKRLKKENRILQLVSNYAGHKSDCEFYCNIECNCGFDKMKDAADEIGEKIRESQKEGKNG